jgi:hypothetical protein
VIDALVASLEDHERIEYPPKEITAAEAVIVHRGAVVEGVVGVHGVESPPPPPLPESPGPASPDDPAPLPEPASPGPSPHPSSAYATEPVKCAPPIENAGTKANSAIERPIVIATVRLVINTYLVDCIVVLVRLISPYIILQ